MIHRRELERIHSLLLQSKEDMEQELSTLPDGTLYCSKRGDQWYYFQLLPKKGNRKKEKRLGITHDSEKVFSLVRKNYIVKALNIVNKDISVLEMAIKHYVNFDEQSVLGAYFNRHPELSEGAYHGQIRAEEWADDYDRQKAFYDKNLKDINAKGIPMRSKNEVYISSRLDHYHIPYRYEASVPHPDVSRIPDFTIRRPRDGKIIYWEHLGMTSDDGYMKRNEAKFIEYENASIVPWDNLIVTYDTEDGGIDAKIIEAMIQGWLL